MKLQILNKITKEIDNIGKVPKNIIRYGTIGSVLLFIAAGITFAVNNYYFNNNNVMYNMIFLMKSSTTILAEVIIGGLLIDHLSKSYQ